MPTIDGDRPQLTEGGTYRVFVGRDALGETIEAEFTVPGESWIGGDYARVTDDSGANAGLGVYQPLALAAGSGCLRDRTTPVLPTTPEDLAAQLMALPRSRVLQPQAAVSAFGLPAVHVRMRVNVDCGQGYYRVAEAPSGSRGISYGMVDTGVVIDFWVLSLGGRPVVVDLWHSVDASPELVASAAEARDSLAFVAGGRRAREPSAVTARSRRCRSCWPAALPGRPRGSRRGRAGRSATSSTTAGWRAAP